MDSVSLVYLISFNSIKVRLRLCQAALSFLSLSCFNSIKVRLRRFVGPFHFTDADVFQFHKGSIKTHIDICGEAPVSGHFRMQRYEKRREKYVDVE